MQPRVCVREKRRGRCYPISPVNIILPPLRLLLSTKVLHASSARHRTPTDPSHTREHMEVSEPLGTQHLWHLDSCYVGGNAKFASAMYKHIPIPSFCYKPYIYASRLVKLATFSRTAEHYSTSYIHRTS